MASSTDKFSPKQLAALVVALVGAGGVGLGSASAIRDQRVDDSIRHIENQTDVLTEIHTRVDEDGVPMVYVPRSWGKTQDAILETLRDTVRTNDRIADALDRLEKR